jgi:hypothetical protein
VTAGKRLFYTHDAMVLVGGAVLVAIGVLVQPSARAHGDYATLERDGLSVRYPRSATWFPPAGSAYPAVISSAQCSSDPRVACAGQPTARIAVRVYDDAMGLSRAQSGKDHDAEYGDRAKRMLAAEAPRDIAGKAWTCMRFAYVPVGARTEVVAVECSLLSEKKLYVVALAGPDGYVSTLEPEIIGTLAVKAPGGGSR